MSIYTAFCQVMDNGHFDEFKGAKDSGLQRLIDATEPFVAKGTLTKQEQQELFERLDERKLNRSRSTA